MVQFPGLAHVRSSMTWIGFPHSDIPVSSLACQLDGAYRRLLRPSSPPDAKAFTVCPSQLDPNSRNLFARPDPPKRTRSATTIIIRDVKDERIRAR